MSSQGKSLCGGDRFEKWKEENEPAISIAGTEGPKLEGTKNKGQGGEGIQGREGEVSRGTGQDTSVAGTST